MFTGSSNYVNQSAIFLVIIIMLHFDTKEVNDEDQETWNYIRKDQGGVRVGFAYRAYYPSFIIYGMSVT